MGVLRASIELKQDAEMFDTFVRWLVAPFSLIQRHRYLLGVTVWSELRATYAGSVLGLVWVVAGPLVLLALYTVVYRVVFRVQPASMSGTQYVLYVLSGLVAFLSFASSLTTGAMSLIKDRQVLLSTVYPAELIGVRTTLLQSFPAIVGLLCTITGSMIFVGLSPILLLVPVVLVLQIMFTCGVVWLLSLVTLVVRDVQHILQYLMFILLIVTPIGYDRDLIPPILQWVIYFNPLYYFVTAYQDILVFGRWPGTLLLCVAAVGSVMSFVVAYGVFRNVKQIFFDYA